MMAGWATGSYVSRGGANPAYNDLARTMGRNNVQVGATGGLSTVPGHMQPTAPGGIPTPAGVPPLARTGTRPVPPDLGHPGPAPEGLHPIATGSPGYTGIGQGATTPLYDWSSGWGPGQQGTYLGGTLGAQSTGAVDPRLAGYSEADLFRSVVGSTNPGLVQALVNKYGEGAYHRLVNQYGTGSGYASQADFQANNPNRNRIADELMAAFGGTAFNGQPPTQTPFATQNWLGNWWSQGQPQTTAASVTQPDLQPGSAQGPGGRTAPAPTMKPIEQIARALAGG